MENISKAFIIVGTMLIAMLIVGVMVYAFHTVSNFAQKQVLEENISEILKFNQPYLEFQSKATYDFSGSEKSIDTGAIAEDILNIVNYTKHVNETSVYKVELKIKYDSSSYNLETFDEKQQQKFIEYDLKKREDGFNRRYKCTLGYDINDVTQRVNSIEIEVK